MKHRDLRKVDLVFRKIARKAKSLWWNIFQIMILEAFLNFIFKNCSSYEL